ncbi:MAG: hypothetical protein ACI956_002099, partial [Nonlabens sp.]
EGLANAQTQRPQDSGGVDPTFTPGRSSGLEKKSSGFQK